MHGHPSPSDRTDPAEAHDHACGGEPLLARAERICRERGLHYTELRRRTLEVIAGEGRALGAYDIAERLSVPGRRVAAVSVYRALDFLTENGLVHRIASRNAFVPCGHGHGGGESTVFLICRTCGTVDETVSRDIQRGLDSTLASAGFKPVSHIVEVEGECGACQERGGAEEGAAQAAPRRPAAVTPGS